MLSTETIFCTPVVAGGLAAAVHATAYIHGEARRHLPRFWFFFVSTVAAMVAVVFADGKLPFLLSLSSRRKRASAKRRGFIFSPAMPGPAR